MPSQTSGSHHGRLAQMKEDRLPIKLRQLTYYNLLGIVAELLRTSIRSG